MIVTVTSMRKKNWIGRTVTEESRVNYVLKMKKHSPVQNMTNFKRLMPNHRFPLLWEIIHSLPFFVEPNQYGGFLHYFTPTVFGTVS